VSVEDIEGGARILVRAMEQKDVPALQRASRARVEALQRHASLEGP
jgi:hypothetical protein